MTPLRISCCGARRRDPSVGSDIPAVRIRLLSNFAIQTKTRMSTQLFTPFPMRGLTLPNRIVVSPMCQYMSVNGSANDWHLMHLGQFAMGAAGLVITEATHVSAIGRISPRCLGLYSDENEKTIKHVVDFCRRYGVAKLGIQLAHAGRKGSAHTPFEGGKALARERRRLDHGGAVRVAVRPRLARAGSAESERAGGREAAVRRIREAGTAHRLRSHRTACRARLPAAPVPVADFESAHRRIRRVARKSHALPARSVRRGTRRSGRRTACLERACPPPTGSTAAGRRKKR